MASSVITLLTDFGLQDTFVGQMKGAMLAYNPALKFVDLTHAVPPQSVLAGALHLRAAWSVFPEGTVHLVVVDPGVGSDRRAISLSYGGHHFIGPDNGVLDGALDGSLPGEVVVLDPERVQDSRMSRTFHGRDLFAPAAAAIASGRSLRALGWQFDPATLNRVHIPKPIQHGDGVRGTVLLIDHFGNAITNIPSGVLDRSHCMRIECRQFSVDKLVASYAGASPGEELAIISSMDTLELAVRDGSAATRYDLCEGAEVTVRLLHKP